MGVLRAGLCPGLTQDMVQLLQSRGIKTVVDLVSADLEEVAQKCGLSYKALVALRRVLLAQFSAFPFNGADLYEELKTSTAILSTGIGRYVFVWQQTWPMACSRTSSTLIPTEGSQPPASSSCFRPGPWTRRSSSASSVLRTGPSDRAHRHLYLSPCVEAGALQRIQVVRAFGIFQMLGVLQDLRGAVSQQVSSSSATLKVVVVDSVAAVVAPLLGGQQREGLALMMQLARELKTLARDLSVAVLVTNHMTRDRDSGQLKPALGRSWSFVPSTRILLDSTQGSGSLGSRRVACLTKSPRLPTGCQETVDLGSWGTPASQGDHKGQWKQSPVFQGNHT
ncbi:DNA repair protein RAD51 homolog 4 isoform X6 [Moschus berezovskii]|uniref:DNA repair protein RAD51 homolog 4 isoform X6 n=1 Tax=Moschus berezovskii TaxID=68408 RepID=UPI0024450B13|nr:DNA repair protein RAD51 homolog 4 isoform X6 [Moschus berezovskii]